MYDFSTIKTELDEGVLNATLDAGPLNLIGPEFVADLVALLDAVERDDTVRVIVFRSAQPDFFIAHVDVARVAQYTAEAAKSGGPDDVSLGALLRRLSETRPVTIAVVEGRARGAGSEFALACDMRFAAPSAVFGQPEIGTGAYPGSGAIQHLARLAGRGNVMQIILGSDDWSAEQAARVGWVNAVLEGDELEKVVGRLARRIASFPEAAVRLAKRRINAVTLPPKEEVQIDAGFYQTLVRDPAVQARLEQLATVGLGTPSRFELEFGAALDDLGKQ